MAMYFTMILFSMRDVLWWCKEPFLSHPPTPTPSPSLSHIHNPFKYIYRKLKFFSCQFYLVFSDRYKSINCFSTFLLILKELNKGKLYTHDKGHKSFDKTNLISNFQLDFFALFMYYVCFSLNFHWGKYCQMENAFVFRNSFNLIKLLIWSI